MAGLLQRLFVFCVTTYTVLVLGNWLKPEIEAGHYWVGVAVLVGTFGLGYLVAEKDERQEFRDAPRLIAGWFVNLPRRLWNRVR
jgi:hypothetical protein